MITELSYENLDDVINPNRGASFSTSYSWQANLGDSNEKFGKFSSSLAFYISTRNKSPLTFATKFSFETIGQDAPFYFLPQIGQDNGLRAFRPERFRGQTSYFQMTDLRWEIFNSDNVVVPFSFGIFGGFDYGRVWQSGEESDTWHTSMGGGFWIAPLDFIVLSFGIHQSEESSLFKFGVGHNF